MDLRSSVNAVRPGRTHMRNYDLFLASLVGILLLFGIVMVYSSSIALVDGSKYDNLSRYYFVARHVIFIAVGLFLMLMTFTIPMSFWEKYAFRLFGIALFCLVLVLIPFIGRQVNGAYRWIPIGPIHFQPSELMKVVIILFTSAYAVRKQRYISQIKRGLSPIFLALVVVALLIGKEPDLGALIVITAVLVSILFLAGLNSIFIFSMLAICSTFFGLMILFAPWRMQRMMAFMTPFNPDFVQSTSYQLSQSLIAIGRGGWFGVGLGSSVGKLHYLPEAHTDFIMSVVGEELGFIGIVAVLIVFLLLVRKGFMIGRQAIAMEREFNGLVAQGVSVWIAVQVVINIGVVSGLLPTKGLTMPLISYGGSSMVMTLIGLGILFRVDYENRQMMRGNKNPGNEARYDV